MKTTEIIEIATKAVKEKFQNYDWSEEAIKAAIAIANGDTELASYVAQAASKLPEWATDEDGRKCPFLWWEYHTLKKGGKK